MYFYLMDSDVPVEMMGLFGWTDTIRFSTYNCSGYANGGKLTTYANGDIYCDDDTSGAGGSAGTLFFGTHSDFAGNSLVYAAPGGFVSQTQSEALVPVNQNVTLDNMACFADSPITAGETVVVYLTKGSCTGAQIIQGMSCTLTSASQTCTDVAAANTISAGDCFTFLFDVTVGQPLDVPARFQCSIERTN
jgi:hypothetical protein